MSTIVDINSQLHVAKFGLNPSAAANDVIQDEGGAVRIATAIAYPVRIKAGGNAGDTAGGAGAEAIAIYGVDVNWNLASEIIATAGASASAYSTNSYLYLYRAHITNSEAVFNIDDIVIEDAAASVYATITDNYGQTERAVFPVFAGYEMHIRKFRFEGVQTASLTGQIGLVAYNIDVGKRVLHAIPFNGSEIGRVNWDKDYKVVPEKTLIYAKMLVISAGTPVVGASFDGQMYRK